ncbi:GIY-YIG nuclease family protein, partial [Patescibacteria group bacterium]|nr:GIY-YIG nuclease family protein [Patescibacteria group bacterium]
MVPNNYFVYVLASKKNGTLYIGITDDLIKRVYEHKNNLVDSFTYPSLFKKNFSSAVSTSFGNKSFLS